MTNFFFRVTLFILIAGFASTNYPQETEWEKIISPVNKTLTNISFVNKTTGWISGELGTIIKTTDRGRNWQIQNSTVPYFITDICFVDENYGWAVTVKEVFPFNTLILKTTNGGEEWTAENFQDSSALMRTIFFFDSLHGFIGGSYIAETIDGGHTWTKATIDSSFLSAYPVYKFKFYNEQFGFACGGAIDIAGVIWRTVDYGKNWFATGVSADQVFDLFMFDSLNAITLSGDPEGFFGIAKIKTLDGGLSWSNEELPMFGLSFSIDFRNANEGWSASGFQLLSSSDSGETWNTKNLPDSVIIYNLQFIDSLTGFAVGYNGAILKFIPPYKEVPPPYQFILYQNYPNPFNPSTKIRFTISQGEKDEMQDVSLKIFDVLGNEVATLVNEEKPAGTYEVEFNAEGLPSGIYFYQMKAGNFVKNNKMVLLK